MIDGVHILLRRVSMRTVTQTEGSSDQVIVGDTTGFSRVVLNFSLEKAGSNFVDTTDFSRVVFQFWPRLPRLKMMNHTAKAGGVLGTF